MCSCVYPIEQLFRKDVFVTQKSVSDEAKAVVRRNTEEVQGKGKFEVFEELFADDFVDHTTQPGTTPDKAGVRKLYTYMRQDFPIFTPKSTGSLQTATVSPRTKRTTGLTRGRFLESLPPIARFTSKPLM
jgi:hypothetical protein